VATSETAGSERADIRDASAPLSAEQLAAVVRAAGDGILVQRGDESIVFANTAAATMLGEIAGDALVGRTFAQLVEKFEALDEAGTPISMVRWPAHRVLEGEREARALVCLRPRAGGAEHWVGITSTPMHDTRGASAFVVTTLRDLTAEKQTEAELRAMQDTLAHKACELAAAVNVRDEFLSIASHELKTPLTSLQLNLDMLVRAVQSGESLSSANVDAMLDSAQRQHRRLARLVNELLDVSRIAAGRLRLEPESIDLVALTKEMCARFEPEVHALGIALSVRAEGELRGHWDRLRIEQVISHLLSNAVRFGRRRPVVVTLRRVGEQAHIIVQDEGIGIAADACDRIFGRFERAVSFHHYGGLGLGLYIVRQIVEAHGGSICVVSRQGEGSTFTIALPL
jgi:PAS domain S-box-containing protein